MMAHTSISIDRIARPRLAFYSKGKTQDSLERRVSWKAYATARDAVFLLHGKDKQCQFLLNTNVAVKFISSRGKETRFSADIYYSHALKSSDSESTVTGTP